MFRFIPLLILFLISGCSFDNKTGIWENSNSPKNIKKKDRFEDFKKLYTEEESFNKIIAPPKDLKILSGKIKKNSNWSDEFYANSNNYENFSYNNLNKVIFRSKKLTKYEINERILFDGKRVIINDEKGNIVIYSVDEKKIIYKYNFYKKRFKKLKKQLNIVVESDFIYVIDNIGYFYKLNFIKNKLVWAKNFKTPFRSNIKIHENKILAADLNNKLYILDKFSGNRLRIIPTENSSLKNEFKNSLALSGDSIFFLNTYGSLYSVNSNNQKIQWFNNFNQSLDLNSGNLFYSNPIVTYKNKVLVSTDPYFYTLDLTSGLMLSKTSITSVVKPIISEGGIFLITKDNLLVYKKLDSDKVIYSINIDQEIAKFLSTKKKSISVQSLFIVNNDLFVFLDNSYLIKFNKKGKIKSIDKLPAKIGTYPIFISSSILYLNKKNQLVILD